jgi:putative lipoprotein
VKLMIGLRFAGVVLGFLLVQGVFAEVASIQGSATYRERVALPPNAVFEASLQDVSKMDVAADLLAKVRIASPGNPPIKFVIPFDPARIEENRTYSVRAVIRAGNDLLFTSDTMTPVLTRGSGNEISIVMRRAGEKQVQARSDALLENTAWKLVWLEGRSVSVTDRLREPYIVLGSKDHRVAGSGGCNRMMGSYKLEGNKLSFGRMAATMMACPDGMDVERAFLAGLERVKTWEIWGEQMEFYDSEGRLIARFDAGDPKEAE